MGSLTRNAATGGASLPDYFASPGGAGQRGDRGGTESEPAHGAVVAQAGARAGHRGGLEDRPGTGAKAALRSSPARGDPGSNLAEQARGHEPLELPAHGGGAGCQQEHGQPLMAAAQPQAAPEPHL